MLVTPEEIKSLNRQVQIPLLLSMLGADPKEIKPFKNHTQYRFPAFWRQGDNVNGAGAFFEHSEGKWRFTDFIQKSVLNLDLIDFIMKVSGKRFQEALDLVIFCSGKDNGYVDPVDEFGFNKPKITKPVPIDHNIFFTFEKGLHPFWANRGYTPDIAEKFFLGWSTYGEMKDRLTIPIVDEHNNLVSIQGRTMDDRIEPKYRFLDGTGESAKLTLYNYRGAAKSAIERNWIGVTESANSVWRAEQYGFSNFVSTLSTSVTDRQLSLLNVLQIPIVIFFDFDDTPTMTGQIAAVNLGNKLLQKGHQNVYMVNIGFHSAPADLTIEQFVMSLKNAIKYQ